ncbi:MAG: hypothetical protein ACRDU8_06195 [Egibacteraceae bacterium]
MWTRARNGPVITALAVAIGVAATGPTSVRAPSDPPDRHVQSGLAEAAPPLVLTVADDLPAFQGRSRRLPQALRARMVGRSWRKGCPVPGASSGC